MGHVKCEKDFLVFQKFPNKESVFFMIYSVFLMSYSIVKASVFFLRDTYDDKSRNFTVTVDL